jgi:queuosine precursor transporter
MNECIFFGHLFLVIAFLWFSLKKGKGALLLFVTLQALFANLFLIKQIHLFGWDVTCSDVYAVGALLGLNFLREIYGVEAAKRAITLSFSSLLFFLCMSQMHLFYLPNAFDDTQSSFYKIFSSTPRIVVASFCIFYLVQRFDSWFFGLLKKRWEKHFFFRMNGSLFCSQLLDTILFTLLGLFGVVQSVVDVIVVSFSIKALVILFSSGALPFLQPLIRRAIDEL